MASKVVAVIFMSSMCQVLSYFSTTFIEVSWFATTEMSAFDNWFPRRHHLTRGNVLEFRVAIMLSTVQLFRKRHNIVIVHIFVDTLFKLVASSMCCVLD